MTKEEAISLKEGDWVLCINNTGAENDFSVNKLYQIGGKYQFRRFWFKNANLICVKYDDNRNNNGWTHNNFKKVENIDVAKVLYKY